jgi:aryl-alcohol dehydrogenase-like predicted oxidoreductase
VILGASGVEQLRQNLAALETVERLTGEVMERIDKLLQNKPQLPTQF